MKRKRIFLGLIGVLFLLFASTLLYVVLRDGDPHRYFTGLGEGITLSPNDSKIAFSYYVDGNESIYVADLAEKKTEKITDGKNGQERRPKYTEDGNRLVFLRENEEGIQTVWTVNHDGNEEKQLTEKDFHVRDAVFSHEEETVFFVAMEAEEWKKGEQSREGFDLYSTGENGGINQLTDDDYFAMDHLFLSSDGQKVYFSEFDGRGERIYSYALEEGTVNDTPSILSEVENHGRSFYNPVLSPDEKYLAFTDVSEESQESSPFEYELFLLDVEEAETERLTNLGKAIHSPVFFNTENKIAFLENTNWPNSPEIFKLQTIDLTTNQIETLQLDLPESTSNGYQLLQILDRAVNTYTIAGLYILLFSMLSVYLQSYHPAKAYLPSIVSFSLTTITFILSIIATVTNPWYGIGLGMLTVGMLVCSFIVVLFTLIYRRFVK
jgi:hypothetical protein